MKRFVVIFFFFMLVFFTTFGQNAVSLEANQPVDVNGLQCGFNIRNEQNIDISKEKFSRYELTVYVTNQSGCPKIVLTNEAMRTMFGGQNDPAAFAIFDCLNATGRRLTSKSAIVRAGQFTIPVQVTERDAEGKQVNRTVNAQAGFILRNGESISNNIIVIVPHGEKPRMQVRVVAFSNL